MEVSLSIIVTLYTIMLGPLKLIGPFAHNTVHADKALKYQIATKAAILSLIISLVTIGLGGYIMTRLNLSVEILTITMGIFMAHWSFQNALAKPGKTIKPIEDPSIKLALFPVAMPEIIPPQAIALLVLSSNIVVDTYNGQESLLIIAVLIVVIMALNWVFMIFAKTFMKIPVFWAIVARLVAVILSAVSIRIIFSGLESLNVIP